MSKVFISYSRQNSKAVDILARKLEDAGHKIWLDRSAIQGGTRWQEEIVRGIERANVFVIVLSPQSIESENVERELGLAHVTGKRILPVMLHRVSVPQPLQYALGSLEIVDISAEDIETASQRVVQAIASPDARTGITYLDALWRDKLPAYLLSGCIGFLVFVLPLVEQRLKNKWAIPIGFLILASIAIVVWAIGKFRRIFIDSRLNKSGIIISTELKGFTKFRDRYRIVSDWQDPQIGRRHRFYSRSAALYRVQPVDRTIPVIIDPRNFKIYRMDLPSLPGEPSGSLALCEPQEAESHVHRPSASSKDLASDVFLSYAEQDAEQVNLLLQKLEAAGHSVWHASEVDEKAASYEEEVIDGIADARVFLLVLSPDSIESTRVRNELDTAVAKRKRIVTAVLRRTALPLDVNYALASAHYLDLFGDFEIGVTRLLETITAETQKVTVVPESPWTARAAWLKPKVRAVFLFLGFIPVFMPLMAILVVLHFASMALPVRLRPSRLQKKCQGWLGLWNDLSLEGNVAWLELEKNLPHQFKERGRLLTTEYESLEVKTDDGGHRQGIRILSLWRDPMTHERYRFRSNWIACEPGYIKAKIIPVYVDPNNLRRYSVDLSFLPADQRRELPNRPSLTRRLQNYLRGIGKPVGKPTSIDVPVVGKEEDASKDRVFVSYSAENVDKADLLIEQLERADYEVVNRSEIEGDRAGEEEREKRISLARTLLIIVPSVGASDLASKVMELRCAYTLKKRVIPIIFADHEIPPSMRLSLAGVQCVDFSHNIESGMRVLLNALNGRKSAQSVAPDRQGEAPHSLAGGRLQRLASSAAMGAFSWALGLSISIVWLDRHSAMPGFALIAPPVVLAYGAVIGAIFHKRRMKVGRLAFTAFVSVVFTPIAVGLFASGHAIEGRDTTALMLTPVLGTAAFIGTKTIYGAVFNYRLKKKGKLIWAECKGSGMSQWRDPVTDEVHTFVRGYRGARSKPIGSGMVAVFMDPASPSDYYVDLSHSPEPKKASGSS